MTPLLHLIAPYVGVVCAIVVLYAAVAAFMAVSDRRTRDAAREAGREREFWRTAKADPRRSARGNWRPPTRSA